jgi:hypothetical protein
MKVLENELMPFAASCASATPSGASGSARVAMAGAQANRDASHTGAAAVPSDSPITLLAKTLTE